MQIITLEQLKNSRDNPLSSGDRFEVREEKIDESLFELYLSIGPDVSSWKAATLTSGPVVDGVAEIWIARVELETPVKGPIAFRVPADSLKSAGIFLGKLSPAGRRESNDYYLPEQPKAGTRLCLTWLSDH